MITYQNNGVVFFDYGDDIISYLQDDYESKYSFFKFCMYYDTLISNCNNGLSTKVIFSLRRDEHHYKLYSLCDRCFSLNFSTSDRHPEHYVLNYGPSFVDEFLVYYINRQ